MEPYVNANKCKLLTLWFKIARKLLTSISHCFEGPMFLCKTR